MKELYYAIPIAGMMVLPAISKTAGIMAVIETEPIKKMRKKDKFRVAVRIKNISNETVDNIVLDGVWAVSFDKTRQLKLVESTTFSLPAGQEIRIPSQGYAEVTIPADWPVGLTKVYAKIHQDKFNIVKEKEKDAWNVGYYADIRNISAPETVYAGMNFDVTLLLELDEGKWDVYIGDMLNKVETIETQGGSISRTYTLTAPSKPGSYTFPVKIVRQYTGETVQSSFAITVKAIPQIEIVDIEVR